MTVSPAAKTTGLIAADTAPHRRLAPPAPCRPQNTLPAAAATRHLQPLARLSFCCTPICL